MAGFPEIDHWEMGLFGSRGHRPRRRTGAYGLWTLGVALVVACSTVLATPVNASSAHDRWSVQRYTSTPYCVTSSLCLGISATPNGRGATVLATTDADGPRPIGPAVITTVIGTSTSTAILTSIACSPRASICAAVGVATGTLHGHSVAGPIVISTNALGKGKWHIVSLGTYSGIAQAQVLVTQVTCMSATSCIAIGATQSYPEHPLMWLTSNAGATWRFESATVPTNSGDGFFDVITCANVTTCVGYDGELLFTDRGPTHFQSAHTPASWTKTTAVTSGVANNDVSTNHEFTSVSCVPGGGGCVGVGSIVTQRVSASGRYSSGPSVPLIATSPTGSVWSALPTVKMPEMPKTTQLDSVSCPAKGECVVAGISGASAGGFGGKPVILRTSGSIQSWRTLSIPRVPALSKTGSVTQGLTCGLIALCSVSFATGSKTVAPFTLSGPA